MDYYDPADHKPMYVDELPPAPPARESAWEKRKREERSRELIHSKHAWFNDWQEKVLSIARPLPGERNDS